jgi:predicted TIM-barrel fold metal-dependent hydrolase
MYGVTMAAPHDVSSAIEEIRRTVNDYGFRGIFMRPNHINGKKWSDPYYDPLYEECQKFNLPVGFHETGSFITPAPPCFSSAPRFRCSTLLDSPSPTCSRGDMILAA